MQCSIGELVEPGLYFATIIACAGLFVFIQIDAARSKKHAAEREFMAYCEAIERFLVFQWALWLEAHSALVSEIDQPMHGQRVTQIVEPL